jgi:hypothetical protein
VDCQRSFARRNVVATLAVARLTPIANGPVLSCPLPAAVRKNLVLRALLSTAAKLATPIEWAIRRGRRRVRNSTLPDNITSDALQEYGELSYLRKP